MPAKRRRAARGLCLAVEPFTSYQVRAVRALRCDIGDRDVQIAAGETVTVVDSREKSRGTQLMVRTEAGQYAWLPAWLFRLVEEVADQDPKELHG